MLEISRFANTNGSKLLVAVGVYTRTITYDMQSLAEVQRISKQRMEPNRLEKLGQSSDHLREIKKELILKLHNL
jgi:hypothetical protein